LSYCLIDLKPFALGTVHDALEIEFSAVRTGESRPFDGVSPFNFIEKNNPMLAIVADMVANFFQSDLLLTMRANGDYRNLPLTHKKTTEERESQHETRDDKQKKGQGV